MPLEFQVSNEGGDGGAVTIPEIISQLTEAGYQPHGYSADGMMLTLADEQGPYQVKVEDALNQLGWQISEVKPENADYSAVSPKWRAAVEMLPNDDTRRAYVEGQMKRLGHTDIQVVGRGRDWYAFNPQSSQWVALTNQPGLGVSDAAGLAAGLPRFAGSLAGGAAGGALAGLAAIPSGPGAIAAGIGGAGVGAGVGSALGGGASRALLAQFDPELANVMKENMGDVAKDVGIESGVDAVTMGAAKGLGPLFRGAINKGPVSSAARAVGAGSEHAGEALSKTSRFLGGVSSSEEAAQAAKAAEGGIGKQVAHALTGPQMRQDITGAVAIPGVAETQAVAYGLQAPSLLGRSLLEGAESLGKTKTMQDLFPGAARGLRTFATRMSRGSPRMPAPERMAEEAAARIGGEKAAIDKTVAMRDVGGNIGERAAMRLSRNPRSVYQSALDEARSAGKPYAESLDLAEEAAKAAEKTLAERSVRWRKSGEAVGKVADTAERAGEGLLSATRMVTRKGLQGAGLAGHVLQHGGRGLKLAGRVAQPLESRGLMRAGAEEALGPDYERLDPWSPRRARARMDQQLAY